MSNITQFWLMQKIPSSEWLDIARLCLYHRQDNAKITKFGFAPAVRHKHLEINDDLDAESRQIEYFGSELAIRF